MADAGLSRINTNIQALNALNALNQVNSKMSVHQLRLATGKRINSAADDAAGFTIASKLKVKSEGLGTALDNIGSAKNLMTVAEGHLNNIKDILTEMKAKAQQAANGTIGSEERAAILAEMQQFNLQIDAEVAQAQWAGVDVLSTDKTFQIGTGTTSADELSVNIAESVWAGGGTTFTSEGLSITASSTTVKTASETVDTATNVTVTAGTSSTINSTYGSGELASGTYTLEVSTTGAGASTGAAVTIRLKDADGNYLAIDADGSAATGDEVSSVLTTTAAASGVATGIDLGNGITVDLTLAAAATAAAGSGSATYAIDYARAGNSVSDMDSAQTFMSQIDSAIDKVTEGLSYVGSQINRMTYQEESLSVAKTNTEAAHSRIVDADMAWEQLEATKLMILQQTATAMLAQANTAPQSVLSLFG